MKSSPKITAVVLCAGSGSRANLGYNKVLHPYDNLPVAIRTIRKFARFDSLIVVCSASDEAFLKENTLDLDVRFVIGGNTRTESVRNALKVIIDTDYVIIHDGARPFVSDEIIDDCIDKALTFGSGVSAYPSLNALKQVQGDKICSIDRNSVYIVQTPQCFDFKRLVASYGSIDGTFADDSEVYEKAGNSVTLSLGSPDNIKLTTPAHFMGLNDNYKVGFGFDVHQFKKNRKLVLCGKVFDTPYGLLGHSDADAPVHAVMDAILSAVGLPDIGVLFPDTDPAYEGADSIELLKKVVEKCTEYEIINVSVCIMAQKPKIAPHSATMRKNLALALGISEDNVNVSATTTEFLGIVGKSKGLASACDVLLRKK